MREKPLAMALMIRSGATACGRSTLRATGAASWSRAALWHRRTARFCLPLERSGGISQHSGIVWEKADAQLAKLSAPLGSVARAETYHAEDNTVTLTLYTENGTKETTLPLTTDILGEWFTNV